MNLKFIPFLIPFSFLALLLAFPWDAQSQAQPYATCFVSGTPNNQNRIVLAPNQGVDITVECQAWPHSVPFGKWGISANVGGGVFEGWHNGKSFCSGVGDPGPGTQWNSCTSKVPPPNCECYNHANCTQQITISGVNSHGSFSGAFPVSCPREYTDGTVHGGCEDVVGVTATLSQNFMTLYELDWPDPDAVVQSLYFPDRSATLTSCDAWSCALAASPWADPVAYDDPVWPPLVYAQMGISISAGLATNDPYGNCALFDCPLCDPVEGCPPCELACGQFPGCEPCPPGYLPPDPECQAILP